ncbi:hypothetical protein [Lichenicoccus roseus]|uniref:Uncharacterized protein n=1 Tax=Lichenicoccus roseus TaxID=2683649 RepID=A0A5R9J796_9PROT|nr:hypothetical protein [Lichenicoccus roseus]TLU73442.1 hypothetical protein FE263_08625 [Lichenicoccus roseus]
MSMTQTSSPAASSADAGSPAAALMGDLGFFGFDTTGRLRPNPPDAMPMMECRWRGRRISTKLQDLSDGVGMIALRAQVGRVPSSLHSAAVRPDALSLASNLPPLLPPGWTLTLACDHSLYLYTEQEVPMPALISDLLVPMVQFCLTAAPFLDLLDENGLGLDR